MSDSERLERGYRRLLAAYPRAYRREHEEEILAVLMAGARRGQRRPGMGESANLIMNAMRVRFRRRGPAVSNPAAAEALALFSVVAPLFLLAADVLQVAVPYRFDLRRLELPPVLAGLASRHPEAGGMSLLHTQLFLVTVGCQVVVAVLALLGRRWAALVALAASGLYWLVARQSIPAIPDPLQLLTAGVYILEATALIASPGPKHGRRLVTWRHSAVLVAAVAAFQASALWYDATHLPIFLRVHPDPWGYLVAGIVLLAVALGLAVAWKVNWFFLLLGGVTVYPFAVQALLAHRGANLLRMPTPGHLALLFVPPLVFAFAAILNAVLPRRYSPAVSAGPDESAPV
jgi:hypothetical protein